MVPYGSGRCQGGCAIIEEKWQRAVLEAGGLIAVIYDDVVRQSLSYPEGRERDVFEQTHGSTKFWFGCLHFAGHRKDWASLVHHVRQWETAILRSSADLIRAYFRSGQGPESDAKFWLLKVLPAIEKELNTRKHDIRGGYSL